MSQVLKVIAPRTANSGPESPYHQIALQVRDVLRCEYAIVATPEDDSVRVQAVVGGEAGSSSQFAVNLISKLPDLKPIVLDDACLVSVPVLRNQTVIALLVGYSSAHGNFTRDHLQRLVAFSHIAVGLLERASPPPDGSARTALSASELFHFSRLITIGEMSACFAHEVTNPLMLIRGHLRFVEEGLPE